MKLKRVINHLLVTDRQLRRIFPRSTLSKIEAAIKASEVVHAGEIRFALEGGLSAAALLNGQSTRDRAIELFSQLGVWDTEDNSGVLIYLLFADRAVEIVADRGINAKLDVQAWSKVCRQMEDAFSQGNFEAGVLSGVQAVTQHLLLHFPSERCNANELPDKPVLL
ncbi:MAG: TPM domain-containing protein [Pseudomonadaceae bacterium]|jgi:hypothetical protein|nr:TPM domain-containing protein [Pseudomonadaceae bacterium]